MSRRVWVPVSQVGPTDTPLTSPLPPEPDVLVEVQREGDPPAPPDTPPQDGTIGALVTATLALADAVTTPAASKPDAERQHRKVRDAAQRLAEATGGRQA